MPFDMYKLIGITFWLITLVAAYWYGGENVQRADLPNELVTATGFDVDSHDFKPTSGGKPLSINPKKSLNITGLAAKPSPSIAQEIESGNRINFDERLSSSHPIQRLQAFAKLLDSPDSQSIELALQAYESLPGGPGRFSELKMLAFAWAQVDPLSAMDWAKKQQHWDEHIASSSIMDSWARQDADGAIAWAKENFEGKENHYFIGIINGLSESNLPKATDLMTELPYGRVRGRSAHILFEKVWNKGEEVAIHWAEHLPEGSLQNFAYGELGEKVARSNMSRAVNWVDSMDESPIKVAVTEDVARELARKDPQSAGNWILQMPEGEAKQTGIKEVSKIWSKKDPASTASWINQFPKDTNVDVAIEQLVRQMTSTDPSGALSWAETISDPEKRKIMIAEAEKVIKAEKFPTGK